MFPGVRRCVFAEEFGAAVDGERAGAIVDVVGTLAATVEHEIRRDVYEQRLDSIGGLGEQLN